MGSGWRCFWVGSTTDTATHCFCWVGVGLGWVGLHSSTQRAHKSERSELQSPFKRTQSCTLHTAGPTELLHTLQAQTSTIRSRTVDLVVSGAWSSWFGLWDFALLVAALLLLYAEFAVQLIDMCCSSNHPTSAHRAAGTLHTAAPNERMRASKRDLSTLQHKRTQTSTPRAHTVYIWLCQVGDRLGLILLLYVCCCMLLLLYNSSAHALLWCCWTDAVAYYLSLIHI